MNCSQGIVSTSSSAVTGNGAFTSAGFTPTAVGTYNWTAAYSGDAHNAAAFSQRPEAEADWVALETTRDPDAATSLFIGFSQEALLDPDPPAWSELLLSSHPSPLSRLEMIEAWRERAE